MQPCLSFILAESFWMPEKAAEGAHTVDALFAFIFWVSAFFSALVIGLLVLFVIKYRRGAQRTHGEAPSHSTALEITWSVIPGILVIIIFYLGVRSYLTLTVPPPDAYEIRVTARMWSWSFAYPNGHIDSELHVPVDTPVQLVLSSDDVIHSLYVPAFRAKKDAVPGRYNRMWFRATREGTFDLYCAAYCGTGHSQMLSRVVVHSPEDFQRWLRDASDWRSRMTPVEAGRMLYERRLGCIQCHSIDGTPRIGPSLKNLYGYEQKFTDGTSAIIDENLIRQFILNPTAKVPVGYAPVMPSYRGQVSEADIDALIAFIKSLSDRGPRITDIPGPATAPTTAPVRPPQ